MISFWHRLDYAIRNWPIANPVRWIFNRPLRDNFRPTAAYKMEWDAAWAEHKRLKKLERDVVPDEVLFGGPVGGGMQPYVELHTDLLDHR